MEDINDEAKRIQMEYATQHFNFPPDSLIDTILGDTLDIVETYVKDAKKKIEEQFPDVEKDQLEEGIKDLTQRYQEATEKIYYKFGCYVKENILNIPSHVLLSEDQVHADQSSSCNSTSFNLAVKNFDALCKRIKVAKVEKSLLEAKLKNLEIVKERQEKLLSRANNLKALRSKVKILDENADIMDKKMETLRPLMTELENNVDTLNTSSSAASVKKRSFENEEIIASKLIKFT